MCIYKIRVLAFSGPCCPLSWGDDLRGYSVVMSGGERFSAGITGDLREGRRGAGLGLPCGTQAEPGEQAWTGRPALLADLHLWGPGRLRKGPWREVGVLAW